MGWACMLYADLIGHWEKRNARPSSTHPSKLDREAAGAGEKYGAPTSVASRRGATGPSREEDEPHRRGGGPRRLLRCRIEQKQDSATSSPALLLRLRGRRPHQRRGVQPRQPVRARLNAIFSSDIGHFDVPDMPRSCPRPTSWSSTACSPTTTSATSCSATRCASGARRTRASSRAPGGQGGGSVAAGRPGPGGGGVAIARTQLRRTGARPHAPVHKWSAEFQTG